MNEASCPMCDGPSVVATKHFPFCSLRCKQRDLGNWFDGVYRLAGEEDDESDDEEESYSRREVLPPLEPEGLDD